MDLEREKMASEERRSAMAAAGKGSGSTDFDRGELGRVIREHYDAGGTEDSALENEYIANAIQSKAGYDFYVAESGRYFKGFDEFVQGEGSKRDLALQEDLANLQREFENSGGAISQEVYDQSVADVKLKYDQAKLGFSQNARGAFAEHRRLRNANAGVASNPGNNGNNVRNELQTVSTQVEENRARLNNTNDPQEREELTAQIKDQEAQLDRLQGTKVFTSKDGEAYVLDYDQNEKGDITLNNGTVIPNREVDLINEAAAQYGVPFGMVAATVKSMKSEGGDEDTLTDDEKDQQLGQKAFLVAQRYAEIMDEKGGKGSIEKAYKEFAFTGTYLADVFSLSSDKDTPLDELMRSKGVTEAGIQYAAEGLNSSVPFKDENGKWLTINQWEKRLPTSLGFAPLDPAKAATTSEPEVNVDVLKPKQNVDTPTSTEEIDPGSVREQMKAKVEERKLAGDTTTESLKKAAVEVGETKARELDSLMNLDNGLPPDVEAVGDHIKKLLSPFVTRPEAKGKTLSQLSSEEFKSLTGGVKFNNDKQAWDFYQKLIAHPEIRNMGEDDLKVVLSFATAGNYFNSFDQVSTERNINFLVNMWKGQNNDVEAVKANMRGLQDNWDKMVKDFETAKTLKEKAEESNKALKSNPDVNQNSPTVQRQIEKNGKDIQRALNIEKTAIEKYYPVVRKNAEHLATVQAARVNTHAAQSRLITEAKAGAMELENFKKQFSMSYHPDGRIISNTMPAGIARIEAIQRGETFNAKKYTEEQNARKVAGEAEAERIYKLAEKHRIPTQLLKKVHTTKDFDKLLFTLGIEEKK